MTNDRTQALLVGLFSAACAYAIVTGLRIANDVPQLITRDHAEIRQFMRDCEGTTHLKREGEYYMLTCR